MYTSWKEEHQASVHNGGNVAYRGCWEGGSYEIPRVWVPVTLMGA